MGSSLILKMTVDKALKELGCGGHEIEHWDAGTVSSKLVGKGSKSEEDMKLPEGLKFFKDTSMSIAIVMFVFYMLVVILAGPESVGAYSGGTNYLIYGLLKALGFTAGVMVLLQGVRMLLGELVPAFKGIADKLVPNAIPALDVPALFGFAPNSLMLGFIFATIGMIVAMFISSALFGVVPLFPSSAPSSPAASRASWATLSAAGAAPWLRASPTASSLSSSPASPTSSSATSPPSEPRAPATTASTPWPS